MKGSARPSATSIVCSSISNGTPGVAVAVAGRVGRVDRLGVEVADRDGVVGDAPGAMAVAAEVDAGRAQVDRADGVEAGRGQLRLQPLRRVAVVVVRVGTQDRRAGRRLGPGQRPVVAADAAVVAEGGVSRGYVERHDRLIVQLGRQVGGAQVRRQEALGGGDRRDLLQPAGERPPAILPEQDAVDRPPGRRLVAEQLELQRQRRALLGPGVDPGGDALQRLGLLLGQRRQAGLGRAGDVEGAQRPIARQRRRPEHGRQLAAREAAHVVELPEPFLGHAKPSPTQTSRRLLRRDVRDAPTVPADRHLPADRPAQLAVARRQLRA